MKKEIIPGDNVSFKTSKYENKAVIDWLNKQSNITDSIRYLIEQDILQNGIRNLQEYIPSRRSITIGYKKLKAENQLSNKDIIRPTELKKFSKEDIEFWKDI